MISNEKIIICINDYKKDSLAYPLCCLLKDSSLLFECDIELKREVIEFADRRNLSYIGAHIRNAI